MSCVNLPWPPSANTYYRRVGAKTLISAAGREYKAAVAKLCAAARIPRHDGRLAVVVEAFPPDRRRRDLDNMLKGVLDSLTHGGAWEDDSQIDDLRIVRGPVKQGGSVTVRIALIGGESGTMAEQN